MKWKSSIFWIIFILVIIGAFTLIFRCAAQQGNGANDLIFGAKQSRLNAGPTDPKWAAPPYKFYPIFHFTATATDGSGATSDFAPSISLQWTTNAPFRIVTASWEAPSNSYPITNYALYWSRDSLSFTNRTNCGTALTATVRVLPPLLTNIVVTIEAERADSLVYSENANGPWNVLGDTTWIVTNPAGNVYWRAMAKSGSPRVKMNCRWQQ